MQNSANQQGSMLIPCRKVFGVILDDGILLEVIKVTILKDSNSSNTTTLIVYKMIEI